MSASERSEVLLVRLVELTDRGQIDWELSGGAPVSFEFVLPTGDRVMIDCRDDDSMPPYDLLVFSEGGELVSRLDWTIPERGVPLAPMLGERNARLRRLWEGARDRVSGAADVLERILGELPGSDLPS